MAAVNGAVFGSVSTPYVQGMAANRDTSFEGVLRKAHCVFVSAASMWDYTRPMLIHRFPWLLLTLPGAVFLVKTGRLRHAGWIGTMAACVGFYLCFSGFEPIAIFEYGTIHYWAWWIPLAALLAYLGAVKARRALGTGGVAALLAPCLLLAGTIKLIPTRSIPPEKTIHEETAGSTASGGVSPAPRNARLVLREHARLPVSKIVIAGLVLPIQKFETVAVSRGDRALKQGREYFVWSTATDTLIVFRRDIAGDDPITVEFPRPEGEAGRRSFQLDPYRLRFGVGVGDLFRLWWRRWLDPVSVRLKGR
jgi:hypothetical protein